MRRTGNTVLITGGGTGIGLALAKRLVSAGNTVIVCGRRQGQLDAAVAEVPGLIAIQADIASEESRASLVLQLTERFPSLNVLVNNAALVDSVDLEDKRYLDLLDKQIAVNLVAPVALAIALLPTLRKQAEATIANVTTGLIYIPSARTSPYSATKAALHSMTVTMRYSLRDTSVRVVEIVPGSYQTELSGRAGYTSNKRGPDQAADGIMRGLIANKAEFMIGIPSAARFAARLMPYLFFKIFNNRESKTEDRRLTAE